MVDTGLRRFIHHSNTKELLTTLADVVAARAMIILYGQGELATGKGRLLQYFVEDYWRNERDSATDWHPILYGDHTSLDWATTLLKDNHNRMVAQVLSTIMEGLQILAERYRPDQTPVRWQQKRRSITTTTQTIWLYNEVCRELKKERVRALIIDNAQSIDGATLQILVQLRQRLQKQGHGMALILAARLAKHEHLDEPMDHIFAQAKIDPRDFKVPVELKVLTQDAFFDTVLDGFFEDLEVEVPEALDAYQEFVAEAL